jgi:hypothetical protein
MGDTGLETSAAAIPDARTSLTLSLRAAELAALAMETHDPLERRRLIAEAREVSAEATPPSWGA